MDKAGMEHGAVLQQAAAMISNGRLGEATALCRQVLNALPGQPEALHLLAIAARDAGEPDRAEALFRESLSHSSPQPAVRISFGNFLRAQGRAAEAEEQFREVIERAPQEVSGWYSLGLLLRTEGRSSEAQACATRVTAMAPGYPAGWELLAAIEQKRGRLEAAISACRSGLRHSPRAARLHYSLGQLLREHCCFAEAALAYESALGCGYDAPALYQNRGEAYYEAGEVERAFASFTDGVRRFPDSALLHRLRAQFHWQSGESGDPLAPLWQSARANPRQVALWQTLVDLLNRLDRKQEGRAALAEARAKGCPPAPEITLLEALALAQAGDPQAATELFARLLGQHPRHTEVKLAFAEHLLSAGDPARAEALCAQVLAENPLDQLAWAYRGTAWQLLGDPRAAWLLDYERMVVPVRVPPPPGYASSDGFFAEVREVLESLHRMQAHPIEQTLRGGTQTNGFLFRLKHPLLQVLEAQIRVAVRRALATFAEDPAHPFWGRRVQHPRGDGIRFAGAWSVRLRDQGFHTNHIHPQGWISSALYIALPREVQDEAGRAGHLRFGVPPAELGLALAPRRSVKPEIGVLTLFPSYMWHGTVPFASTQPRITVAFDLLPQD